MSKDLLPDDKYKTRRKFPRRELRRMVGVLCRGRYLKFMSLEIGEGGMSIQSTYVLDKSSPIVVTFQIPGSGFVSVQAEVRSTQKKDSESFVTHGVVFKNIQFSHKRLIRTYVSDRASTQANISIQPS